MLAEVLADDKNEDGENTMRQKYFFAVLSFNLIHFD